MKNKILGAACIIAIGVLATFNINLTNIENDSVDLASTSMNISSANAEWGGWSNFFEGQGFYKDEREERFDCPSQESSNWGVSVGVQFEGGNIGVGINGGNSQTNPSGSERIECPYGDTNCTEVDC